METIADLLGRDRRRRDHALVTPDGRERSYHELITNAYKAANVLRHLGARQGMTVAVAPVPDLQPTLALLGAAGLGARVRFDPAAGVREGDRVVLVRVADEAAFEPAPGTNLATFGGPPDRPETTHWEKELWSENPGMPPAEVAPDDPFVVGGGDGDDGDDADDGDDSSTRRDVSHGALVAAAGSVNDRFDVGPGVRVVLRTTLADPRALAAGVIAPLSGGATAVLVGPGEGSPDVAARGDLAVVDDDADSPVDTPEPQRLRVSDVPL